MKRKGKQLVRAHPLAITPNSDPPGGSAPQSGGIFILDDFIEKPDDVPPASAAAPNPARQNALRLVANLQDAANAALERKPQIRTGQALRKEMERDEGGRAALAFSDPASIDRVLARHVRAYKLGLAAR